MTPSWCVIPSRAILEVGPLHSQSHILRKALAHSASLTGRSVCGSKSHVGILDPQDQESKEATRIRRRRTRS
jgi:hypothetical protein